MLKNHQKKGQTQNVLMSAITGGRGYNCFVFVCKVNSVLRLLLLQYVYIVIILLNINTSMQMLFACRRGNYIEFKDGRTCQKFETYFGVSTRI